MAKITDTINHAAEIKASIKALQTELKPLEVVIRKRLTEGQKIETKQNHSASLSTALDKYYASEANVLSIITDYNADDIQSAISINVEKFRMIAGIDSESYLSMKKTTPRLSIK